MYIYQYTFILENLRTNETSTYIYIFIHTQVTEKYLMHSFN